MASQTVIAGRERRAGRAAGVEARLEWFADDVQRRMNLTFEQRVQIATEFLRDMVVKNISVPVLKRVVGNRTRVLERSKPGEFPRADKPHLMRTIFADGPNREGDRIVGHVGMPLDYGVILELYRDRSFLNRTLEEQRSRIVRMLTGPIA